MDKNSNEENLLVRWLDNRLNDNEKKQIEKSGELDGFKVVLDDIDTWKVKKFDIKAGLEDLKRRKKQTATHTPVRQLNTKHWMSIAASILILITGTYFSWNYFSNQSTTINTQVAENKTIKLPNGSVIKLDALSEVSYKEKDWENNRTIYLSGQAYFDVTKGDFKVITDKGSVAVLGTQFNVNTNHKKFEVKCFEGKVNVVYKNDSKILTEGQAVFSNENELISDSHTSETPNWMNGFTKYNKVLLSEVILDLEKYYNTKIQLPKKYVNLQFTGNITHKDLNTALKTLFTSMEIKYTSHKNSVIVE